MFVLSLKITAIGFQLSFFWQSMGSGHLLKLSLCLSMCVCAIIIFWKIVESDNWNEWKGEEGVIGFWESASVRRTNKQKDFQIKPHYLKSLTSPKPMMSMMMTRISLVLQLRNFSFNFCSTEIENKNSKWRSNLKKRFFFFSFILIWTMTIRGCLVPLQYSIKAIRHFENVFPPFFVLLRCYKKKNYYYGLIIKFNNQ
jgi:hypothetical protein